MKSLKEFEVWFVTGSQDLYGEDTLKKVAEHSQEIARSLDADAEIPVRIVFKPTVKSSEKFMQYVLNQTLLKVVSAL